MEKNKNSASTFLYGQTPLYFDVVRKEKRNSNFELMRVISMFLIVLWHIIMHGHVIENCTNPAIRFILELIMFLIIIHVNSFVLLSGYFQSKSKFKLSKLIKIFLQVVFYSMTILGLANILGWTSGCTIVTIFNNMSLTSLNNYWFIKTYLVMYVFSDYINKFIDRLSHTEYRNFLLLCFVVLSIVPFITGHKVIWNDGFTFFNFIYLYMIGGYLRRYPLKETYHFKHISQNGYRFILILGFFSLGFINYLINRVAIEMNGSSHIFSEIYTRIHATYFDYSTPFVMIQTVLYFEFFKTIQIRNQWINKIAVCMFGIYLIHDNELIRGHIYRLLGIDRGPFSGYMIFPKILGVAIFIFVVCLGIEYLRAWVGKKMSSLHCIKQLEEKFKSFINSFKIHINW